MLALTCVLSRFCLSFLPLCPFNRCSHGIPDARPLEEGDIVNIDITVYYKGFHGDLNETHVVGAPQNIDPKSKELIRVTHDALHKAIEAVKPGAMFRDFGDIITKATGKAGFSVVRTYS